jgi:16S rRNA (guanine527-N7)-methyltransferase
MAVSPGPAAYPGPPGNPGPPGDPAAEAAPIAPGRDGFLAAFPVSRETLARLDRFLDLLAKAQARTNLVAASTLADPWLRHVADSAQLLDLAPPGARWADIGAGAGFPGMVLAIMGAEVELIEPRRLRADFLRHAVADLGLEARARVHQARAETVRLKPPGAITARAVAHVDKLFDWGGRFAAQETRFILPRGSAAAQELMDARTRFHLARARLVPSRTAPGSAILVAQGVSQKRGC